MSKKMTSSYARVTYIHLSIVNNTKHETLNGPPKLEKRSTTTMWGHITSGIVDSNFKWMSVSDIMNEHFNEYFPRN